MQVVQQGAGCDPTKKSKGLAKSTGRSMTAWGWTSLAVDGSRGGAAVQWAGGQRGRGRKGGCVGIVTAMAVAQLDQSKGHADVIPRYFQWPPLPQPIQTRIAARWGSAADLSSRVPAK